MKSAYLYNQLSDQENRTFLEPQRVIFLPPTMGNGGQALPLPALGQPGIEPLTCSAKQTLLWACELVTLALCLCEQAWAPILQPSVFRGHLPAP